MSDDLLNTLRIDGVVSQGNASLEPLTGGVSSDIFLVVDGDKKFVVKRALAKLKVEAEWFADVSRNETERAYIQYVARTHPTHVPGILAAGDGYFAMEYLGDSFTNWKEAMLNGHFEEDWARLAGSFLGDIHRLTANNPEVARQFDNMESFWQLRIDPYLVVTGDRYPELKTIFLAEAERLKNETSALVHGDFSPKNILVSPDRLVVLDCEVACYADPAFDVAFLFTHLLLKCLYHKNYYREVQSMIRLFLESYGLLNLELEARIARLLLLLLLARVDGKSPVEYLVDEKSKEFVRSFSRVELIQNPRGLEMIIEEWVSGIRTLSA